MSDQNALLNAIIAQPEEDTPRLAYADWLDENERDPDRAAFIRVQCRLADVSPADPEWVGLIEQQDELVARLKHQFLTNIGEDVDNFYFGTELLDEHEEAFRRGFPYFIGCQLSGLQWTPEEVKRVAGDLTTLVQTTTLRGFEPYSTPADRLTELLESPVIAKLTGLALALEAASDGSDSDFAKCYKAFCNNPNLRGIKHLYLYHGTPAGAVAELAKAKTFDSVRRLSIQFLSAPKATLDKLSRAPWFRRLRHFRCLLGRAEAAPMITGLGKLPDLHTLDLPGFAAGAVSALAAGKFPALAWLGLPLSDAGAKTLAKAKFPALAVLNVSGLKNDGLLAILKAKWVEQLRVLDLEGNSIGDKGIAALAAHPVAKTLRVLKLGDNAFGPGGLKAIGNPGAFPALTTLSLRSFHKRKAKPAELATFLSKLEAPNLRHLDLMGWPLGNAGAEALAANSSLANLRRLNLDSCEIGDPGAKAIFASPHLQNLVELHAGYNSIKTAADVIANPKVLPRLGECWISGNRIPKKTADNLDREGLYLIT